MHTCAQGHAALSQSHAWIMGVRYGLDQAAEQQQPGGVAGPALSSEVRGQRACSEGVVQAMQQTMQW